MIDIQDGDIYSDEQRNYHLIVLKFIAIDTYLCYYIEQNYFVHYNIADAVIHNGLLKVA